jgi:hypothetical protein
MCHELMYSRRSAANETRKREPQEVKEAPPRAKAEAKKEKVPEPA